MRRETALAGGGAPGRAQAACRGSRKLLDDVLQPERTFGRALTSTLSPRCFAAALSRDDPFRLAIFTAKVLPSAAMPGKKSKRSFARYSDPRPEIENSKSRCTVTFSKTISRVYFRLCAAAACAARQIAPGEGGAR